MAAANILRRGSGLCQSVKFSITGTPARHIQCNCLNCQKSSGSAFLTNILFKRDQYKVESGAEHIKVFKDTSTDSGGTLERSFCSNCGSPLHIRNVSNPKMSGNIVVCGGTIDENYKNFKPQSELFPHRRHAWVPEVQKAKKEASKM
ncbi:hypothetical protein CLAFUW4_09450 [Fulvia fulva]|uniref:CENP-V/GFA domain-containing protein n=1 Tax=Passalora fulva TaxID=5499 RepID=A0A9Q8PFQ5_PASFU|nr:uncharacterized protein CLAFUR5_09547 [Fulvia fulva]KAK4613858.1 hypothetical protein CLAFUR4_09456 [Fulvia fulva]KAK4614284.1 hypothetical protein CLAFUR0_09447 [Fulvia fulva]UJO21651.1 hypothetical protein CLAFUR5_09547 [Fulvia fulva]WPV20352.1 hypothetical protein CLAFUW4_09450 [Fulvia fulva]WPV35078.1 hypothetical protein CLAFUW7_09451 [Fulvia fulva]